MRSKSAAWAASTSRQYDNSASLAVIAPNTMPAAFAAEVGLSAACDPDSHDNVARAATSANRIETLVSRVTGYAALRPPYDRCAVSIACQMRWLVVGISICVTPSGASASSTALTIAGKAPTVPASPAPLAPIGLSLVGQGLLSTLIAPRSAARGIA